MQSQLHQQHQGKVKRKRSLSLDFGGRGAKIHNKGKPGGKFKIKKGDKLEIRSCHRCGEVGHLRPNFPNRENSSGDELPPVTPIISSE